MRMEMNFIENLQTCRNLNFISEVKTPEKFGKKLLQSASILIT